MIMHRTPVPSTRIKSWAYDPETQTLQIEFHTPSDCVWEYRTVPPALWAAAQQAESPGKFFDASIKGHFEAYRLQ